MRTQARLLVSHNMDTAEHVPTGARPRGQAATARWWGERWHLWALPGHCTRRTSTALSPTLRSTLRHREGHLTPRTAARVLTQVAGLRALSILL